MDFLKKSVIKLVAISMLLPILSTNVSAFGGTMTCENLKTELSKDSVETGAAIVALSEDCEAELVVKSGQSVTLNLNQHTLSSETTALAVETGGQLFLSSEGKIAAKTVLDNSGKTTISGGTLTGAIVNQTGATLSISGGTFSVDPTAYLASGYVATETSGTYVVEKNQPASTKDNFPENSWNITASDTVKNALAATLKTYYDNPDSSTTVGRQAAQLINSIKQGHALTAELILDDSPSVSDSELELLLQASSGVNLAAVYDIKFQVNDLTDASLSVALADLSTPVTVTLPIPSMYREQLRAKNINIIHVHQNEDSELETSILGTAGFDSEGNVTFEARSFSLFALTYDGDPITVASDGSSVPTTSGSATVSEDVSVPNTAGFLGLDLSVFHLLMLIAISLVVSALAAYALKRASARRQIYFK